MVFNPLWISAGADVASTIGSFFNNGGSEGLDRSEQRWLADFSWKQSLRNEDYQRKLAEEGIQIRTKDAMAAGLHPLAALGVAPSGGSPVVSAFGGAPASKHPSRWPEHVSRMGQNLTRAMMTTATQQERELHEAQIYKLATEGDLATAQAEQARAVTAQVGKTPAYPDPYGQSGVSGDIAPKHQLIRLPDGSTRWEYSDAYARSQMGRPLSSWLNDFRDILGSPNTKQLLRNTSWGRFGDRSYEGNYKRGR